MANGRGTSARGVIISPELREDYTARNLADIVSARNELVRKADGLDEALFQYRGHEIRKLTDH